MDLVPVRLEEVGARPELRGGVRGEEDLQGQRAAGRLVGNLGKFATCNESCCTQPCCDIKLSLTKNVMVATNDGNPTQAD